MKIIEHSLKFFFLIRYKMFTPYQMDGSLVQFRFYCSSGQGLTRVDTIKINEGYWHFIVLEWIGKNAKIIIDGTQRHTAVPLEQTTCLTSTAMTCSFGLK